MGKKQSNSHSQDSLGNREKIGKNNPPKHTRFSSTNQPLNSGRTKGSRSRSTIVREWLEATESMKNPITGESEKLTQYDIITLALIQKARKGDVQAFKELMDSSFGKIPDKLLAENKNTFQSDLTQEESRQIINRLKSELDTNNG
jgi:hypothetical protein